MSSFGKKYVFLSWACALFLYALFNIPTAVFFKAVIFFIWWWCGASLIAPALKNIFQVEGWLKRGLSVFLSLFIFGLVTNIFTAWFVFSRLTVFLALIITPGVLFFWFNYFYRLPATEDKISVGGNSISGFKFKKYFFLIFIALAVWGWQIIFSVRTGIYLASPWQVLPWSYVVVISCLGLMVYALIFSRHKTSTILVFIVIFSFLLHSYLLVYQTGFGGDRWRHLGSEYRLLSGLEYQPTLLTNNLWYSSVLGVNVPRALIDAPKLSYGFQWSLSAVASKILNIDVFYFDQFWGLILWSFFLPIIMLVAARQIWPDKRLGLLSAAVPLLFYVLQYYGSQTLPIVFGLLYFVFLLALWLAYWRNPRREVLWFGIFLTLLGYFGYSLTFILGVIMLALIIILQWPKLWRIIGITLLSLSIFILELLSTVNNLNLSVSLKTFFVQLGTQSNLLYFSSGRWLPFFYGDWSMAVASRIFFVILSAAIVLVVVMASGPLFKDKNKSLIFLRWLFVVVLANYLLSWNFLTGLHFLSRRLDAFLVIIFSLIFAWIIWSMSKDSHWRAIVAVIFLTLITVSTYISGPILDAAITSNDVAATRYVWEQIKDRPDEFCVMANTWPLLSLEAFSAEQVVAGNFPSDFNHQQPERVALYRAITVSPNPEVLDNILSVSGKNNCLVMIDKQALNVASLGTLNSLLGQPVVIGDYAIWRTGK